MRIISGIYKSRTLLSPRTYNVRPTSDRAKETLFNILGHRFRFEDKTCIDLFCGTGNLGLECISRGAGMCYFVDEDTTLVKKNIETLEAAGNSKVIRSEAIKFIKSFSETNIDLVFCDPPYDYKHYKTLIEEISKLKSVLILEHGADYEKDPALAENIFLEKKVGTVHFTFFDFKINK